MSDDDGSSGAARGAQPEKTAERPGFLGRLLTWGSDPTNSTETDHQGVGSTDVPLSDLPGMSNLQRKRIEDVAIPKAEIVAVPVDVSLDELLTQFRESGFTRLPVYDGTLDMPLGLVHLKDVALEHGFNGGGEDFDLRPLIRPLLFAPPSMPIGVLLQKMQSQRVHMALVIDEYGGTDGLVTIEDLIEQVIGEIEDEHDVDEDEYWQEEAPGCYLALARTPLDEFEAEIGRPLTLPEFDEDVDSLGGLVFLLTGRVPARGEIVRHPSGVEIEVVDADPRRIKRLRIRLPKGPRAKDA